MDSASLGLAEFSRSSLDIIPLMLAKMLDLCYTNLHYGLKTSYSGNYWAGERW